MKIIDLLVKINNDEEVPKKIGYNGEIFTFDNKTYVSEDGEDLFSDVYNWFNDMNIKVAIIEDKEIEKFVFGELEDSAHFEIKTKINQLIDVINDMRDKEC